MADNNAVQAFKAIIKEANIASFFNLETLELSPLGKQLKKWLPTSNAHNSQPYFYAYAENSKLYESNSWLLYAPPFKIGILLGSDILWLTKDNSFCVVNVLSLARIHRVASVHLLSFMDITEQLRKLYGYIKLGEMTGIIQRYSTRAEYERLLN